MKKKTNKNMDKTKKFETKDLKTTSQAKNKSTNKTASKKAKTKNTKEQKNQSKDNKIAKIIMTAIIIVILILSFIKLGLKFTLVLAVGIAIIVGISALLGKIKNKKRKKVIRIFLIIFLILGILGLIAFSSFLVYITVTAPKFNPNRLQTREVTIMYDKDGKEITKMGSEKREKVTYDELPEVLVDAIVSTEDSRFFEHNGFDAPRFIKATLGQIVGKSNAGGASTLSMQVIKNSFTSTESSGIKGLVRKFTDIYLAIFKLEKNYSKEEIIEYYVNNHFLGGNIYGVEEASQAYFNKSVGDLNLSEAAILAGMFKSPNYYKPTTNPENATKRRKTVLYLMKRHGYITEEEEEMANSIPVEVITKNASGGTSNGATQYQGYIDTVVEELEDKYGVNPYNESLLIYTNMDRSKQEGINKVMNGETYNWINDKVQSGVSVLDSNTGKILAVGAGRNKQGASTFNYATSINRQPGSTAKPLFDYGPGIEYNNWSTYEQFLDGPYKYSNGRSISNWDNSYKGQMTLRKALALSRNIPALKAFQAVDNKKIIEFVQNLGIEPEIENGKIHEAHSIGAFSGVNPVQMSAAYAAFSNGGYYNEPYTITKIVYRDTGKEVEHKSEKKKVMSEATAFMISSVLQDVALTGGSLKNVAAKTGTTNYDDKVVRSKGLPLDAIRDSWVVGYSTKTVIAMWYGYDFIDKEYCLRNLPATVQKDNLFKAIANQVLESNREEFKMPDSVVKLPIISGSNPAKIAPSGYTGQVVYEYFKKDHQPTASSQTDAKLSKPANLKATYANNKVTLTWNPVNNPESNSSYGTFGYNIYQGNVLLDFVTETSYTFQTNNPYTTYKVVATYQSYNGLTSDAATISLKEEKPKDPVTPTTKTIKYKISYHCVDGKTPSTENTITKEREATSTTDTLTLTSAIEKPTDVSFSQCFTKTIDTTKPKLSFPLTVKNGELINIYYSCDTCIE
ncbi:MAG: transglycosylase domain-containing protein [Bacilli bacterium]|nr:transglycosylase domain-containing protein [Bacilli bacterium]